MKALSLLGFVFLGVSLHAQVILTDDFNGGSLDTSKWTTILPYGSSTVVQSSGVVTTTGRGILATVNGYQSAYVMTGSFTMNSDLEHFAIGFRTDLSALPDVDLYHTLSGMFVEFSNDGDQISIQGRGYSPENSVPSDHKSYSLTTGQTYSFSITDTGTNIAVAINGVNELTATTSNSTGNKFAFYSREFASTSTSIDSIAVTAIPEPSTYAAIFGLVGLAVAAIRRRACV